MRDLLVRWLRQHPLIWGTGLCLTGALLGTAVLRTVAVRTVETSAEARRAAVVEEALSTIENRFASLRGALHDQAHGLADDSSVVNGLRRGRKESRRPAGLVEDVVGQSLDAHTSVEVYASGMRLLAWEGLQMPVDSARFGDTVPREPRSTVVTDGKGRHALAAWAPVRHDGRLLGAVRVVRIVRYRPPVRNRYIQAMSLEDRWTQETGEVVWVRWSATPPDAPHRALPGVDDAVLGYASVDPPSPHRLVERTATFYTDLLVAWVVLLLGWGLVLVGRWYLRLARRPGLRRHSGARQATARRLGVLALFAIAVRYAVLLLDVPVRWAAPGTGLSALFDPTYFASTIGAGIFRSIGDLLLTGLWAGGLAVGLVHLAWRYCPRVDMPGELLEVFRRHRREWSAGWSEDAPRRPHAGRFLTTLVLLVAVGLGGIVALASVVRRAVLDSTLDFFSRRLSGLLPEPLLLGVLCGLFLLVAAGILAGTGGAWIAVRRLLRTRPDRWSRGISLALGAVLLAGSLAGLYLGTDVEALVSLPFMLATLGGITAVVLYGLLGLERGEEILTLRGLLGGLFVVTLLLYPLLYRGMDEKRRGHMIDAAHSFGEGQDPRVLYSMRQVLQSASDAFGPLFQGDGPGQEAQVDSVALQLVRQSLLASLTTYQVELSLLERDGTVRRQYVPSGRLERISSAQTARAAFASLRLRYERSPGPVIEQLPRSTTGHPTVRSPFQYAGLLGLPPGGDSTEAWVLLRAEPQSLLPGTGFGVPRVLLPDGSFRGPYRELSLAEFREGTLVRSFGQDFGRTRLGPSERARLEEQTALWREEVVRDRRYLTYYRRFVSEEDASPSIVAVRTPAILAFDHLYYLLRLTIAGLCVGLLVYLLGLYVRYRQGRLPAPRVRFRNKVLNAFLVVGIVSMVAVGVVGVRVVTGENERAVERRMHDHLTRVEEVLALEAQPREPLWRVAGRMSVDSLATRVGLDLHLYRDGRLVRTSQPRLRRDGLVDGRLPGDVYHALYDEAYRFVTDEARIGTFRYRVGYQALIDADGRPRLVIGVPTLAQQEQLQEEQSRTLAYLFGALLLLVVVVMLTGVVLANALAQPIAQLREGLEAVGEGRFARTLSVDTRDEIGDLVQTFNEMRDQLAESRRKLARQERELAWREMARQVAHEIKNPLTPMKLSIQHLRRAYKRTDGMDDSSHFADVFDRITSTLIEQVESLVRIADEFSTFARLPTRVPEPVDLNEVIREAASLMEEESIDHAAIELDLHDEPLVVEADRGELRRIYINLLKNALQAIPERRDGCVRVTTQWVEAADGPAPAVRSRVIDNGTGIPPDLRDKIFEPNFSTKTSGTGLGLAIAKKGVEELGGEIGFETTEGEGTTFWVQLPAAEEG